MKIVRVFDGYKASLQLLQRRSLLDVEPSQSESERFQAVYNADISAHEFVERVFTEVRLDGDSAVRRICEALGETCPDPIRAEDTEIDLAIKESDPRMLADLELAAARIRRFHEQTIPDDWADPNMEVGQLFRPLDSVGIYAPGGRAAYPSSVLMTAIPAKVAGVDKLVVLSPGDDTGQIPATTLAAARIAGADAIYAIGGAQAIAAMSMGTESIPRVDKIAGPGNIFVVLAMRRAFGLTGVSTLPGPTETLLIADKTANSREIAADLIAQAEHDTLAAPILLTDSSTLAAEVEIELSIQISDLPRKDIVVAALKGRGGIGVMDSLDEAVTLANKYAPEHLCLLTNDPRELLKKVRNAGGVFMGTHSPEVLGDYVAGPSHVMPVGGTARFASPVTVNDFMKTISLFNLSQELSLKLTPLAARLARYEGLEGHARAAEIRIPNDD